MRNIIKKLKNAEKELLEIQECSWGKIPGNTTPGKSYKTTFKNLLNNDDKEQLRNVLTIDEWEDLVRSCGIMYSETDDSDEPFVWKHHMYHSFTYYIDKLENVEV